MSKPYYTPHGIVQSGEGFRPKPIVHACGYPMMGCAKCDQVFCVECDFCLSHVAKCCERARGSYYEEHGQPEAKIGFKKNEKPLKLKVNIEEVGNGEL